MLEKVNISHLLVCNVIEKEIEREKVQMKPPLAQIDFFFLKFEMSLILEKFLF